MCGPSPDTIVSLSLTLCYSYNPVESDRYRPIQPSPIQYNKSNANQYTRWVQCSLPRKALQRIPSSTFRTNLSTIKSIRRVLSWPETRGDNTERDHQPSPAPPATPVRKAAEKQRGRNLAAQGRGALALAVPSLFPPPGPVWLLGLFLPWPSEMDGEEKELLCYHVFYCTTVRKYNTKVQKYPSHNSTELSYNRSSTRSAKCPLASSLLQPAPKDKKHSLTH